MDWKNPEGPYLVHYESLVRVFTCVDCAEIQKIPPFYHCPKGHVTCRSCSVKNRQCCCQCRQRIQRTRNATAERAAVFVFFPAGECGASNVGFDAAE